MYKKNILKNSTVDIDLLHYGPHYRHKVYARWKTL